MPLTVQANQVALYDVSVKRLVEPGTFTVTVGDQAASFEVLDS